MELSDVDVTVEAIDETTFTVLAVELPAALIHRPLKRYHLAESFSDELLVLSIVYVSVVVEELSNARELALSELTLKDHILTLEQEHARPVVLVITEWASVDVAIRHRHLALVALVVPPDSLETGTIRPCHNAEALTFTCFEVAFVCRFLVL